MGEGAEEFALLVKGDGGLHLIIGAPVTLEGAAAWVGASAAYHVKRSEDRVTVNGSSAGRKCLLENVRPRARAAGLLRDRPLYSVAPPLLQ